MMRRRGLVLGFRYNAGFMLPISAMLVMIVGGIALSQAVSDPHQVTLRWLRLGGIINFAMLAGMAAILLLTDAQAMSLTFWLAFCVTLALLIAQLMLVQLGKRSTQRWCAVGGFLAASCVVFLAMHDMAVPLAIPAMRDTPSIAMPTVSITALLLTAPVSTGLCGSFIMVMLLGHAYLTAGGEMTQQPFIRLVKWLALLLVLRTILSLVFGLIPYMQFDDPYPPLTRGIMIWARYLVGLVVPAVFTCMIYDCVKRRSNQSATGILYVAGFLVIMGEGFALHLLTTNSWVF